MVRCVAVLGWYATACAGWSAPATAPPPLAAATAPPPSLLTRRALLRPRLSGWRVGHAPVAALASPFPSPDLPSRAGQYGAATEYQTSPWPVKVGAVLSTQHPDPLPRPSTPTLDPDARPHREAHREAHPEAHPEAHREPHPDLTPTPSPAPPLPAPLPPPPPTPPRHPPPPHHRDATLFRHHAFRIRHPTPSPPR